MDKLCLGKNHAGQEREHRVGLTRSIVLVGLMGAGKTSVGKRLAAHLGVPFQDSDDAIREAAGMEISEMFVTLGEPAFRAGERKVIARLLSGAPLVLATGGGAFMDDSTRQIIAKAGVSVFLKAELSTLWARVKDKPGRPLLDTDAPRETLAALMAARTPVYDLADVTVQSEPGQPHEVMVLRIVDALAALPGGDALVPSDPREVPNAR
ncbi:MAG: shikimate kinase [Pseudomonadota bacterium]